MILLAEIQAHHLAFFFKEVQRQSFPFLKRSRETTLFASIPSTSSSSPYSSLSFLFQNLFSPMFVFSMCVLLILTFSSIPASPSSRLVNFPPFHFHDYNMNTLFSKESLLHCSLYNHPGIFDHRSLRSFRIVSILNDREKWCSVLKNEVHDSHQYIILMMCWLMCL